MSQLRPVKRKKTNIPWVYLSLGFFVVITLVVYFGLQYLSPQNEEDTITPFTICSYNVAKTQDTLESLKYTDVIEIKDYLIYGETLNLYSDFYVLGKSDYIVGKTLIVKNICDGYEWVYMIEKSVDGQIPLELLPNGFYEVYVVDNLVQKRVISIQDINEFFYPVVRDGSMKTIQILASTRLGSSEEREVKLDQRYLYLYVSDSNEIERKEVYDIVIDAAHSSYVGSSIEKGQSAFNMVEANETVRMALLVADELEKAGLKVYLTRDDTEDVIDLYGESGRLYNAYQSKAKYYLELNTIHSNNNSRSGAIMTYSRFSSNRFATTVFKAYLEAEIISAYGRESNSNIAGVTPASMYDGYDSLPVVRESGGRILGAGTMSEASRENASFNAQERFGIQTISLDLFHLSNEEDAMAFANNGKVLAQSIAQGIINYFRIEGVSE